MAFGGGFVIDADIEGFFDNLDHGHLREFLDRRVTDGVLRTVIHKWLRAGVLEDGNIKYPVSFRQTCMTRRGEAGYSGRHGHGRDREN